MSRRWTQRILSAIGSGSSLLVFICGWLIYYVTIAVWSKEALSRFVGALHENIAVQIITFLFIADFLAYIIRTALKIAAARKWMLLLWLPFHLGLLLFLMGFYINAVMSQDGKIVVGEGDTIAPPWGKSSVTVERIEPGLKDELLGVDSPESAIFQYEPMAVLSGESGTQYEIKGYPPKKIGSTYYHILEFGLAPGIRLSQEGRIIIDSHVIQRLLPPGRTDSFFLGDLPYRVQIRIAPSRTIKKGTTESPVFNLKDLHFTASVYRGEDEIFEGPSGDGIFFDGMKLEFTPQIYWARVEAAQRPGMEPFVLGLFLTALGFPLWVVLKIMHLMQRRRIESDR